MMRRRVKPVGKFRQSGVSDGIAKLAMRIKRFNLVSITSAPLTLATGDRDTVQCFLTISFRSRFLKRRQVQRLISVGVRAPQHTSLSA
jgi:hypothetical protein